MMLCQLTKGGFDKADKRPQMSELRGSSGIINNAHIIMLLHRPSVVDASLKVPGGTEAVELIIAKSRNSGTGIIELGFDAETTMFRGVK